MYAHFIILFYCLFIIVALEALLIINKTITKNVLLEIINLSKKYILNNDIKVM